MFKKSVCSLMLLFFLLPIATYAMPCHCFSARDFDPKEPAAADPYYLATSQNSFFSVSFDMEKKNVVFAKQKPSSTAEGLWVLNWLALTTEVETKKIKKGKKATGSWRGALVNAGVAPKSLPADFWDLIIAGASDNQLAQFIVDELLKTKGVISAAELQILRTAKASNEETILAAFLGRKTTQHPSTFFQTVASGETTWGTHMLKAGMQGRDMVEEIRTLLEQQPNT